MSIIRWLLGRIIFVVDFLFRPRLYKHNAETQAQYDEASKTLSLFQYAACPFCVKVRRSMKRQSVNFELRDAKNNPQHRSELEAGGGKIKVPCLRIEKQGQVEWMYESSDIVAYLEKEFA